jgi:Lrp/AsnC family leucine-responsive transcriptional regulator
VQHEQEGLSMRSLDAVDLRILRELRFDARIKNSELAQKVGLSPTPCWNRVRALERDGVIQRYVTILDAEKLGLPDLVFVEVMLTSHDEATLDAFGRAVVDLPEVVEAWLVSGEYDYMIKVAVAGSAGYERFLRERLFRLPGIRHTRSSFALGCLKQSYSPSPTAAPA